MGSSPKNAWDPGNQFFTTCFYSYLGCSSNTSGGALLDSCWLSIFSSELLKSKPTDFIFLVQRKPVDMITKDNWLRNPHVSKRQLMIFKRYRYIIIHIIYVYIYIYMYIYIYTNIYILYIYIHTHIYIYVYIYI